MMIIIRITADTANESLQIYSLIVSFYDEFKSVNDLILCNVYNMITILCSDIMVWE